MTNIPGSFIPVQQLACNFNFPVGIEGQIAQGAILNAILSILSPVGTVIYAMITEAQFQAALGNPNPATWILADGRDVTGSAYATLVGSNTVVNLTGQFIRGKNNGRSDGNQNPDGDLPLGTYTSDKTGGHLHEIYAYQQVLEGSGSQRVETRFDTGATYNTSANTSASGGNEMAPKNLTLNAFIRIN